ncbi:hypothetical protein N7493_008062 [Penicillium malachiteum]|uniref:SNF2 family helicase/ATPase n=1 Tax=Penicillium malachiteum TaxID=1324776 RepID=A0AAD6HGJ6_9EURO|nr:hypothetical protein N7493_008062 [Penicillium malachiteum]
MARESDAPGVPLTPRRPHEAPKSSVQQPEFGKPSPLGPPQRSSNHLFNIPKQNRARPEHHRAPQPTQTQPQQQSQPTPQPNRLPQGFRPPGTTGGGSATPSANRSAAFDPFKPVRPSAYTEYRSAVPPGATPIKRPQNVNYTTPRAPRALFSSKPSAKPSNASSNLQNFIDLTSDKTSFNQPSTPRYGGNSSFGSIDTYSYVDAEKANENIKALLEGAFEEEEEAKPKSKGKKKGKKGKKTNKKQAKESSPAEAVPAQKKDPIDDLDDLAAQLQGVTVNDKEEAADSTKEVDEGQTETVVDEEKDTKVGEEDDEEEDEEDDEEEEEEEALIIEGLKVNLLPHQVEGVRWMCDKESGQRSAKGIVPKGGILADDMGLGKTVQAISLILKNRKPENDEHSENTESAKTKDDEDEPPASRLSTSTLVVAPLALIKQWEAEIADKIEKTHRLRVCVYHGTNRAKTAASLDDFDVVITTYGTLTSEAATAAADKAKKSGIFSVYWYRIILDEAHTIKNRNAKATQAACTLDAKYRWCLSGTPMQNNLDELQSLIKFLRIKPYNDLAAWRDQITRPLNNGRGGLAIQRLQVYLKAFMKRRTKDVLKQNQNDNSDDDSTGEPKKSNGFKIVKREVIRVDAEFLEGEQNYYDRLEKRTENRLDEMMGGEKVDYAGALVLLLRLRQACNHPDLVKSDLATNKDVLLQNGNPGSQSSKESKKDDLDDMADLFGGLSVVTKKCDVCQAELSKSEAKSGASRCNECEADLNINIMGKDKKKKKKSKVHRHHEITTVASPTAQRARARKNRRVIMDSDDEEDEAEWIVPEDQRKMPNLGQAGGSDDEDAEGGGEWIGSDDSDTDEEDIDSPSGKKTRPIVLSSSEDESDSDDGDDISYKGENGELPSTKIRHLMKILHKESADYKFIVFSVFTSMLDKIEPFLNSANIGFARYDGQMRNDHREASLNKLRNNRGTRVLLCSLRAGALGLNLTAASRVVILEPFWNPFVEEQAIDRVHRLNQTVDVKIYRMVIKGTVEERIVALQDRKRELANMTIEGKSAAGKLTMRDMMALFGRDAESKFPDKQETLDFKQKTRLLASNDESPPPKSPAKSDPRYRDHRQQSSRPEDSVYGRRW